MLAEREHAELIREVDEVSIAMLEDHEEMLEQARRRLPKLFYWLQPFGQAVPRRMEHWH